MAKLLGSYPTTSVSLIQRLAHGDDRDWQRFYTMYSPILLRIGAFSGLTATESDDLVANVMRAMLVAVRGGFRVDPRRGRFRSFLRSIANSEVYRLFRDRKRSHRNGKAIDDIADPRIKLADETWATIERQELLRNGLERVRESRRVSPRNLEAFDRYVFRDEPAAQIAESLGVTVNRFYGIIFEIKQRIRAECAKLLVELGDD